MALLETAVENLKVALEGLTEKVDRAIDEDWQQIVTDAHELLDRLNGTRIVSTFEIPARKLKG